MRILNDLRALGEPFEILERRGRTNVYGIPQGSRGAMIAMTEFEMIGVAVAQQIARYLEGTPMFESLDQIFTKMEAALKRHDMVGNLRRKIHDVNEGAMLFKKRDGENIQALLDGLLRDQQVSVKHDKVDGGKVAFLVDPYTLLLHRKGPYLMGRSHHPAHGGEVRRFALDGIRSLEWCKGKAFAYPASYSPERELRHAFGIVRGAPSRIRVRFHSSVERSVKRRRWHRSQKVSPVVDGWFTFEMRCAPSFEVKSWLLSWGSRATVLEPKALVEELRLELEEACAGYRVTGAGAGGGRPSRRAGRDRTREDAV
jgi:predicted DNA-binding transcriptional regulator YafY